MHVLIPSTYAVDERDDKLKVHTYGRLARALAIFGADTVTIYRDADPKADEQKNAKLLEKYLGYAECPPYLRKDLIPHDPDLQYANIMPALQILSHGYTDRFREGVVTESSGEQSVVEAGLEEPVTVEERLEEGERVTLRMGDRVEVVDRDAVDGFWTFTVRNERSDLGTVLDTLDVPAIGTSRQGEPLSAFVSSRFASMRDVAVVFGSQWRGIPALIDRGDCGEDQFAGTFNFVPGQETKTVRTEEAVPLVLGVMNAFQATE